MLNTCVFISLGLPTGVGVAASSRIPALLAAGDALGARNMTEMSKVKHPMDAGRKGQRGIEW
jgi:hypothetical protein